MKAGPVIAIIGIVIVLFALLNHFALNIGRSTQHIDIYIGVLGAVVLVAGAVMSMTGRKAA